MKNDLISRADAIRVVSGLDSSFVKYIEELPSAQPEQRRIGKWIIRTLDRTEWYRVACSECGEDVTATIPLIGAFPYYKALWNYCPECGADMRGEQDE